MASKTKARLLALLLAVVAFPAAATFHLVKVVEVFPGTALQPNAQYIVLQAYASGENHFAGHSLHVFNAAGAPIGDITFPADLPNSANQMKVLVATTQAQSFFGVTADKVMSPVLLSAGGKICWEEIDCVAWGTYKGVATGVGTPINATGGGLTFGRAAMRRLNIVGGAGTLDAGDDTNNSANDFTFGTPAPRNNAGTTGHAPAAACGNGTLQGLEQCDDGNTGNGDGCSNACRVEAAAIPNLSIANISTNEGNSGGHNTTFMLLLSKASPGPTTYNIATRNGTATAGSDYVAKAMSGQSIPAGTTSKAFAVTVLGDTTKEADEAFSVLLGNVNGAKVVKGTAAATIVNDDVPTLSIADVAVAEGNTGTRLATFTVKLSRAASTAVTYSVATTNGTAAAGSDYVASSLTGQTIAAGSTSRTFTVTIDGDTTMENNEVFRVNLTDVVGASLADGLALGTILNDDGPTLSIASISSKEGNAGTHAAQFTVKLSQAATTPVTFNFATANGSAIAGSDYVAQNLTGVTIPAGNLGKVIGVTIDGDTRVEPDERFTVKLSNASGASILAGSATGTITNDDTTPPTLSIADIGTTEGSVNHDVTFTVQLSRAASAPVTYTISTQNGTATAGEDYVAKSANLGIAAGQTSKAFKVTVLGDSKMENNETFNVRVSNLKGATLGDGVATATIDDDDYTYGY